MIWWLQFSYEKNNSSYSSCSLSWYFVYFIWTDVWAAVDCPWSLEITLRETVGIRTFETRKTVLGNKSLNWRERILLFHRIFNSKKYPFLHLWIHSNFDLLRIAKTKIPHCKSCSHHFACCNTRWIPSIINRRPHAFLTGCFSRYDWSNHSPSCSARPDVAA